MTPAKRRRVLRAIIILVIALLGGVLGRYLFLDQGLASLLLGRKPGSLPAGTSLVRNVVGTSTNRSSSVVQKLLPTDHPSPQKLKFKILANWKFEEGKTPIPEEVRQFDGQWVKITGYMLAINQTAEMDHFLLVQSLWSCCFGQTPKINHIIAVTMERGKHAVFNSDPVTVTGRFIVGELREGKTLVSIYQMDASDVVVY